MKREWRRRRRPSGQKLSQNLSCSTLPCQSEKPDLTTILASCRAAARSQPKTLYLWGRKKKKRKDKMGPRLSEKLPFLLKSPTAFQVSKSCRDLTDRHITRLPHHGCSVSRGLTSRRFWQCYQAKAIKTKYLTTVKQVVLKRQAMGSNTCTSLSVYNKSTSKHNLKGVWYSSKLSNRNEVP